jgi:Histidine kinase
VEHLSEIQLRKRLHRIQVFFWVLYFLFFFLFNLSDEKGHIYLALSYSTKITIFHILVIYGHIFLVMPYWFKRMYLRSILMSLMIISVLVIGRRLIEFQVLSFLHFPNVVFWNSHAIIYNYAMAYISVAISVPIKFSFDYFQLQNHQKELLNQQLQSEMKYLKMQINPHFLFNTLNNLYYLTQVKSDLAPQIVYKLAELMRYMLEKGKEELVSLDTEIAFIQAYLDLERIRIPHISIKFEISGDEKKIKIPPLLLIPLVENAFKHGIDKSNPNNFVNLYLTIETNQMYFRVENRYYPHHKKEQKDGLGLSNLKKRLSLLYGDRFILNVYKIDEDQFVSEMNIPI